MRKKDDDFVAGQIDKGTTKKSKKSIMNMIGVFAEDEDLIGLFKFNEFSSKIEYAKAPSWRPAVHVGKPINDDDLVFMKWQVAKRFGMEAPKTLVLEGLIVYAHQNGYHPVRDYIKAIKWDGIPRINDWLYQAAGVAKDAYTQEVARRILIAAVARVFNPGCEVHSMLILEGGQGIGKSSLVKILAGPYYANMSFANIDKDTIDAMQGRWIIEVDELVGFSRQDVEKMKSFIVNPQDRARLSYKMTTEDFPRQCIFIGTTNPIGDNTYFRDESGNRRFWPVVCGKINLAWLREFRDQLFAEAYEVWKAGETPFLSAQEAIDLSKVTQEDRMAIDPWTEPLATFMDSKKNLYVGHVTVLDLAKALGIETSKLSKFEQSRIGTVVKNLGYEKKRIMKDGVKMTVYPVTPAFEEKTDNGGDMDNGKGCPTGQPDNQGQP